MYEASLQRVDRVPGFLSSRPNWFSPPPHPQASVAFPFDTGGGTHSLTGEGVGGPNSDEGTDTVVLEVCIKNPSTPPVHEGKSKTVCAAEAVFCYTAENSLHLEAVTSKNPQFQEEKISERRKARSQITLEKSSKNYISLFGGKPARGLPTPCTPHPSAQRNRTFYTWRLRAGKCDPQVRFLLAGGGGRGDLRNGAIR